MVAVNLRLTATFSSSTFRLKSYKVERQGKTVKYTPANFFSNLTFHFRLQFQSFLCQST